MKHDPDKVLRIRPTIPNVTPQAAVDKLMEKFFHVRAWLRQEGKLSRPYVPPKRVESAFLTRQAD